MKGKVWPKKERREAERLLQLGVLFVCCFVYLDFSHSLVFHSVKQQHKNQHFKELQAEFQLNSVKFS